MELIIDESSLALSASKSPDSLNTARTVENIDLYIHPTEVPFGLMIVDDKRGMLGAFDENGNHRGSLAGTDEAIINWLEDVYTQYKTDAQHISEISIDPENM